MKKVTFQLEQLLCPSCVKKIETTVKKQEGIEDVKVLFNSSKAKINFDEAVTDTDKISKVISDLGFEVLSSK